MLRQAAQDVLSQWAWFAAGVSPRRVGYGGGPLTWARSMRHKLVKRDIHVCLLTCSSNHMQFGPLTAWAINQGSRRCSASLNEGLERADIVWVYAQDPLTAECRTELEQRLRAARPDAKVINRPSAYNGYHQAGAFRLLSENGVSVPRSAFGEQDVGATRVVYKQFGQQAAPKRNVLYGGPRPGMTPFEFIDSAREDGLYRRFRAHYLAGFVRPSEAFLSDDWNVCMRNAIEVQYGFSLTAYEADQIRHIADVLELDYFAVDFVRRGSDDQPFFTDVNVYPTIGSPRRFVHGRGDFGQWHTFDACDRLDVDEPLGGSVWDHFDTAMLRFAQDGHERSRSPVVLTPWSRPVPAVASLQAAGAVASGQLAVANQALDAQDRRIPA